MNTKRIIYIGLIASIFSFLVSCNNHTKSNEATTSKSEARGLVGGGCEGCELMYVGMPSTIHAVDTSAAWNEKGQKLLVTGKVYNRDGKTPAPNVVIYYWHTDNKGLYSPIKNTHSDARQHGHIRGWVKTDAQGNYSIFTIRPAPYPNETLPAHIHISIKELNINNEYFIDDLVFDDDKLLNTEKRNALANRGGSGILRVILKKDLHVAEHDIILGLNIPNYPYTLTVR